MKDLVLMWSGGMDSTLLLYKLLQHDIDVDYKRLRTISFYTTNNGKHVLPTSDLQVKLRKKFIKKFKKIFGRWEHTEICIDEIFNMYNHGYKFSQQPLMLSLAVTNLKIDENLTIGFIKGGDIEESINDYKQLFNSFCSLKFNEKYIPELLMPLRYYSKKDVVSQIDKLKLSKYVTACDSNNILTTLKPCGKCYKCIEVKLLRKIIKKESKLK